MYTCILFININNNCLSTRVILTNRYSVERPISVVHTTANRWAASVRFIGVSVLGAVRLLARVWVALRAANFTASVCSKILFIDSALWYGTLDQFASITFSRTTEAHSTCIFRVPEWSWNRKGMTRGHELTSVVNLTNRVF